MKVDKPVSKQEEQRARAIVLRAVNQRNRRDTEAKRRLIGRCYKYPNSFSDRERWWLYAIITGVDEHGRISVSQAQADTNNCVSVTTDVYGGLLPSGGWIEIDRAEFDAACVAIARRFLAELPSPEAVDAVRRTTDHPS